MPDVGTHLPGSPGDLTYASVPLLPMTWLLPNYVPMGEVTVWAAKGGTGKTFTFSDFAGRITTGRPMPDGTPTVRGSVIWITAEDDPATTLSWRFRAARADTRKIIDLSYVEQTKPTRRDMDSPLVWVKTGEVTPFTLGGKKDCLWALREKIAEIKDVRLVVIDTLAGVSAYGLTSVARVRQEIMRPLQQVARDTGVAVVVLHHLTKAGSVAGSQAVVDTARSVVMVTPDGVLNTVRIYKTNVGDRSAPALSYWLSGEWPDTAVVWTGESEDGPAVHTAEDAVLDALRAAGEPLSEQQISAETGLIYPAVRMIMPMLGDKVAPAGEGLWALAPAREETVNEAA